MAISCPECVCESQSVLARSPVGGPAKPEKLPGIPIGFADSFLNPVDSCCSEETQSTTASVGAPSVGSLLSADTSSSSWRYELGERLGKGASASVVAALDTETGERVAVKQVTREYLRSKGSEPLELEVAAMKRLSHPAVMPLRGLYETDDHVCLVMQLAKGGDLLTRLRREGPFTEEQARGYFRKLVAGLAHCHRQGVYHLDIKPENLFLDGSGGLIIGDFGCCKLRSAAGGDGLLHKAVGSPSYLAPEVVDCLLTKGRTGYDGAAADAWSAGVVLYTMISGCRPFSTFDGILQGNFRMPPNISPELQDLLRGLLTVDTASRYTLTDVARHPWLFQCSPEHPVTASAA